jgi:hypothetical protein
MGKVKAIGGFWAEWFHDPVSKYQNCVACNNVALRVEWLKIDWKEEDKIREAGEAAPALNQAGKGGGLIHGGSVEVVGSDWIPNMFWYLD